MLTFQTLIQLRVSQYPLGMKSHTRGTVRHHRTLVVARRRVGNLDRPLELKY